MSKEKNIAEISIRRVDQKDDLNEGRIQVESRWVVWRTAEVLVRAWEGRTEWALLRRHFYGHAIRSRERASTCNRGPLSRLSLLSRVPGRFSQDMWQGWYGKGWTRSNEYNKRSASDNKTI